jgi:hypothetical protein
VPRGVQVRVLSPVPNILRNFLGIFVYGVFLAHMPDIITKSVTTSYGQRVVNSFGGMLGGVIIFLGSFALLYWNEGRVDLSKIAAKALEIPAVTSGTSGEGSLVSTTGPITTTTQVGDPDFILPGAYINLERRVEIYAWVETEKEETTTNSDGSETTTTTYTYKKDWTTTLEDSSNFAEPSGHTNPADFDYQPDTWTVPTLKIGELTVPTADLNLPPSSPLTLTKDLLTPTGLRAQQGNYLFFGAGSASAPVVGDERLSYQVVKPDFTGTIFGQRTGEQITKFTDPDGNVLFRLFVGGRDAALTLMHQEYVITLWLLRALGLFLMWAGLAGILKPFATIIDRFPFLGSIAKAGVGIVALLIALPLTIVTIIVSMIIHSWLAIVVVLALFGGWLYWSKSQAGPVTP